MAATTNWRGDSHGVIERFLSSVSQHLGVGSAQGQTGARAPSRSELIDFGNVRGESSVGSGSVVKNREGI